MANPGHVLCVTSVGGSLTRKEKIKCALTPERRIETPAYRFGQYVW